MVLNWSIGVIITFISLIPSSLASVLTLIQYFKDKYSHLKYLSGIWICLTIWIFFQGISDLLLSIPLHIIGFYSLMVVNYFANQFVDSITRESTDIIKMIIVSISSTAILIFSLLPNAVIIKEDAATPFVTFTGNFRYAAMVQVFLFILITTYGNLKVFLHTPKQLKFYSFLNLFGTYLYGIQPLWIQFTHLEDRFPGAANGSMAIGTLLISMVIIQHPKLAYVIPLKVYRILIMDTKSGLILFKHDWNELKAKSSENILSGMLQAVNTMFDQTINKGNVRDIKFDQAILTYEKSRKTSIACIIISNKISKTLRTSFSDFADDVFKDYENTKENSLIKKNNEKCEILLEQYFPFVPKFD
ncbi:hypothetical protein DSAG12_03431 [Promethearchaeum syntrophicum]|uniref:Uncharacterized protein n=1 Tax=Promethearchaeum syntrophicum TaxID=2594042 RepID=A0A5B9DEQ2_9ARCH|nr:hypothetical protein [Candidatus Prometheoarchaeum syntrophicum]QEE17594.1 hypothetical protein DSAG12_03431 [Candidatus Prometheoarchaeum syntrophicum]